MHLRTFFNGILVGVLLGVLFAPDSGDETRRKLSQRAAGIKDTIDDTYDEIASNVTDTYSKVKTKAKDVMNKGENVANNLQDDTDNMYQ